MDSRNRILESPVQSEPEFLASLLPVLRRIIVSGFRIPASDREDVLQDSLLAFFRHGETHAVSPGLLVRIVQRRCQDYWRRVARRREVSLEGVLADESLHPVGPDCGSDFSGLQLVVAWRLISPQCREYLARRFWRSERPRQIAAAVGKQQATVQRFLARCLARLRRSVEAT